MIVRRVFEIAVAGHSATVRLHGTALQHIRRANSGAEPTFLWEVVCPDCNDEEHGRERCAGTLPAGVLGVHQTRTAAFDAADDHSAATQPL